MTAELTPLVEERRRALRQVRLQLAEHARRTGKVTSLAGKFSEKIGWFKDLAPAIKTVVGAPAFDLFWSDLWLVSDDGATMVIAQPSRWLMDVTAPHLSAIGEVAGRVVELVISSKPAAGSCKVDGGTRRIGDVVVGAGRDRQSADGGREGEGG